MAFLIRVAVSTFAVWIAVGVIDGLEFDGSFWDLILIGLILGVINASIKPLLKVLSIPVIVISLALFLLVINWAMFAFAKSTLARAGTAPVRIDIASGIFVKARTWQYASRPT